MATLIQDPRQPSHKRSWPNSNPNGNGYSAATAPNPNQRFQYAPPASRPSAIAGPVNGGGTAYDSLPPPPSLPPHNEVEMTREMLVTVLDYFSQLLPQHFDWNTIQGQPSGPTGSPPQGMRLVVHGGACMLLHPGLYALSKQQQSASPSRAGRTKTRDVDYIHRGFVAEYGQNRIPDAAERLRECIQATARRFNLGADWMNSDADIALPMAHDPNGKIYDPIYTASISPQNIALHTIYKSANGFLTLISVTPFWAVALKLVRYTKYDPGDICLLLRNGTLLSKTQWTPETLEGWLLTECWAMGYVNFDARKKAEMRSRIEHAIQTLAEWNHYVGSGYSPPGRSTGSGNGGSSGDLNGLSRHSGERDRERDRGRARDRDRDNNMETPLSAHDVMGGGAVVGGQFASQHGWSYSFGPSPAGGQTHIALGPSAVFPPARGSGGGETSNIPPPPPNAPPGRLHVSQWGSSSGAREKSKSRSKSKSRNASRVASRNNSPRQSQEIFIPPDIASDSEEEDGYGAGTSYDRSQTQPWGYEHPSQSTWVPLNPNHAPATIPAPHSRMTNPNPTSQTAAAAWLSQTQPQMQTHTGANRTNDPYGMHILDQAIGSVPYGSTMYSSPQEYADRLPGAAPRMSGAGFQPVVPVIPVIPTDALPQLRKKEKPHKVERPQARGSKARYQSDTESDDSEGDSDIDEHDKENRLRGERGRQFDPLGKKLAQSGPWHQIYAPAPGGRSTFGPQSQMPSVQQQQQQLLHAQDPSRQYPSYSLAQDASSSLLGVGRKSRPASRNPSPNPDNKRRPPPLDLTPPPVIPGLPPQIQGQDGGPVIPAAAFADPALLAHYQFEQQQKSYQREREERQMLSEREKAFYQRRQFTQVPAQHQQQAQQQQQQQQHQQQHMYQHQQYQQMQQQHQQQQQYQYQYQQHMPRTYR